MMASMNDIIENLSSPQAHDRKAAALALYRAGVKLTAEVIARWQKDAELAALLLGQPAVGVAVLPGSFARIHKAFGAPPLADVPPDQDAREFEVHLGEASLDIITVREEDSATPGAIARFLEKFGEGIQQVEYGVTDVDRATEILRTRFQLAAVYPRTRAGADNTRINFFLSPTSGGRKALIELVESPRAPR
jgi:methylmalonyl-CoA/ethylmalonyl-CoA epimerase